MLDRIKKVFDYKLFRWIRQTVRHEKNKRTENERHQKWLKSNEYIQHVRCQPWFAIDGDNTMWLQHDLNEHSLVFDVGGYKGEFAASMMARYNCVVYIFEPLPEFFNIIKGKFAGNPKVHSYCFGLSDKTGSESISLSDNSSSVFIKDTQTVEIDLKNIVNFMNEQKIEMVDLIKINIEGSEYGLLECLLDNNFIKKFRNIQVQFHDFIIPNAKQRMENIQNRLKQTHEVTYQYEFVWENWKLR